MPMLPIPPALMVALALFAGMAAFVSLLSATSNARRLVPVRLPRSGAHRSGRGVR